MSPYFAVINKLHNGSANTLVSHNRLENGTQAFMLWTTAQITFRYHQNSETPQPSSTYCYAPLVRIQKGDISVDNTAKIMPLIRLAVSDMDCRIMLKRNKEQLPRQLTRLCLVSYTWNILPPPVTRASPAEFDKSGCGVDFTSLILEPRNSAGRCPSLYMYQAT